MKRLKRRWHLYWFNHYGDLFSKLPTTPTPLREMINSKLVYHSHMYSVYNKFFSK